MDFFCALPATYNTPNVDSVEDRQHHGAGPHPEGGGLRGRALLEGAERILLLAHQRQLRLLPAFIPSEENLQADAASRFQLVPDWHLDPSIYLQMSTLWGPPQIDLFASRQSAQTQRFYSWRAADAPEAIDALSLSWDFSLALLFPPIPLLKRVIRKLELSSSRHPILGSPDLVRLSKRFRWKTSTVFHSATTSSST
jgi:hypothetical protein